MSAFPEGTVKRSLGPGSPDFGPISPLDLLASAPREESNTSGLRGLRSLVPHCRLQYNGLRLSGSPKCKRGLMSERGVGWMKRNCSERGKKTGKDAHSPSPCLSRFFTRHAV